MTGFVQLLPAYREPTKAEVWAELNAILPWRRAKCSHWDSRRWVGKQGRRLAVRRRAIETRFKGRHDRWTA